MASKSDKIEGLLPVLSIDFALGPAENILPCTEVRQAKLLGWYVNEVRSVNQTLGVYNSLPMICRGSQCYWNHMCPTAPDFLWFGLRCPLEMMDCFRSFVRYVRELNVSPDKHVDLIQIADLVRIDLQMKRIDQQIQVDGMLTDQLAGIAQAESKPFYEKGSHPSLRDQAKLRTQRDAIYKKLIANRDDREELRQKEGKEKLTLLDVLTRAKSLGKDRIIDAIAGEQKALSSGNYVHVPDGENDEL